LRALKAAAAVARAFSTAVSGGHVRRGARIVILLCGGDKRDRIETVNKPKAA